MWGFQTLAQLSTGVAIGKLYESKGKALMPKATVEAVVVRDLLLVLAPLLRLFEMR